MASWKHRSLWLAWGLIFGLAILCAGILVQGVIRDTRPFEPIIRLAMTSPSEWVSEPFRVWGVETYDLRISSANQDAALVGRPLEASLEVRVLNPDGDAVLHRIYRAGETGHHIPDGYGDFRLDTLTLSGWPLHSWTLQVRVTDPDPAFVTVFTEVRLYERRYDPGMSGLVSYAMIVPSVIFMLLALALAVPLAKAGARLPLVLTSLAWFLVFLVLG